MHVKIKRALISVSDKTDIIPVARLLQTFGCEIISTGGTLKALEKEGIKVTEISDVTKNPEAFGGRVKTLSFQTSAALLHNRDTDREEAAELGVTPIDLVICNFYPFKKVYESDADMATLIENVDIGGPTMVRSAAKNYKSVTVITDMVDYQTLCEELEANAGATTESFREKMMCKAFNYTADYDAFVSMGMDKMQGKRSLRLSFSQGRELRYGENSHQSAYFYKEVGSDGSLYDMKVLNGKELSFNNLMDINSAIDSVKGLKRAACSVIKHNTPCGMAECPTLAEAIRLAWQGDPISAFGSVIAFNGIVDEEAVSFFELKNPDRSKRKFIEVVIAPGYTAGALEVLKVQKNLRVVEYSLEPEKVSHDIRYFKGSLLLQDPDTRLFEGFNCVTEKKAEGEERDLMEFGIKAVRQVKSNAIVVVRKRENGAYQLLGMGAGQPNRLVSVSLAMDKCRTNLTNEYIGPKEGLDDYIREELKKAVLVSEAFFPFADSVDTCAQYGIKTILQPGGSIRDSEVIAACNKEEICMVMTGLRHFKH